ncbi:2-oxoglutarate-dependent dioxygenase htyE-like [Dendronephthya gigantea]|uniref:2-oxoglutarate-dependent dioxygenase htyE-like n=1 Tax=Dendronephthya gigantea TaxID=151771 RepID=UPI00106B38EE|nr:2-oxoglutarate-dependent dioxygenase htyE-like [Dendronephthya gigantea]
MACEIPVVDFQNFDSASFDEEKLDETNPDIKKLSQEILSAFTTVGFVYIKNHGLPETEIRQVFQVGEKFFKLPTNEKSKYSKPPTSNHGYVAVGVETTDPSKPTDFKEAFNITEPFNDEIPWPDAGDCSDFRFTMNRFFDLCKNLSHKIMYLISLGLKLKDRKLFHRTHKNIGTPENKTTLRLLYYPVMTQLRAGQVRLGEHSDYGTITLLFQDQIGGLEVRGGEGFIPAYPIEGTILVNIGDLLQRWTNDRLMSTKHRVVVPREEIRRLSPRQSAAFFVHPDDDAIIQCLDGSKHYPPITSLEYLLQRLNATYL